MEAEAPRSQLVSRIVRLRLGYEGAPRQRLARRSSDTAGRRPQRQAFRAGRSEVAFYAKVASAMPWAWCRVASTAIGRTRHGNGTCCSKISPTRTKWRAWPLPPDEASAGASCRRWRACMPRCGTIRGSALSIGTRVEAETARQAMQRHAGASSASPIHLGDRLSRERRQLMSASSPPRPACRRVS